MTVEELRGLGLTDGVLEREYRKEFGRSISIPPGNRDDAQARRREVFNAVCASWFAS